MCLAIPGKVIELDMERQSAAIDYNGVIKNASTMLMPQVAVEDYVLVHAGFIIQILTADYGKDLNQLTEELGLV